VSWVEELKKKGGVFSLAFMCCVIGYCFVLRDRVDFHLERVQRRGGRRKGEEKKAKYSILLANISHEEVLFKQKEGEGEEEKGDPTLLLLVRSSVR